MSIIDRFKSAWNAFLNRAPTGGYEYRDLGLGSYYRPDRPVLTRGGERSIVTSVYNRISLDVSSIGIKHVKTDENNRFVEEIDDGLNQCFNLEANIDQTGRSFIQDIVLSMLDEGCVAIVPIDTSANPMITDSFKINSMRTGKIVEWHPKFVKINVYNDRTGLREDIILPKSRVAIVENPLYAVINEPNSTMQRLIRKLSLLDAVDAKNSSEKLDLIIQLPYVVKTRSREEQAEQRRTSIENQLTGSKYGIAYIDGTEKITQLNRPVENNLQSQIEYLTSMLYSQLGLTVEILNGSADEKAMLNYYNRTVEPIVAAITDETKRKFISKTARAQHQTMMYFRDPFKLVPVNDLAQIADSFTRNEIMTSNEVRQIIGMKPSDDPNANELRNKNLNKSPDQENYASGYESEDGMDTMLSIPASSLMEK